MSVRDPERQSGDNGWYVPAIASLDTLAAPEKNGDSRTRNGRCTASLHAQNASDGGVIRARTGQPPSDTFNDPIPMGKTAHDYRNQQGRKAAGFQSLRARRGCAAVGAALSNR